MLDLNKIDKYVINLKSRTDRLDHIKKEFEYAKWNFNLFEAIDTGSYEGCALSHVEVAKIAKKRNLDYVMVLEDDIFFMPYGLELLSECLSELESKEWDLFHLAPSIHRRINYSSGNLVDLSAEHPPKRPSDRGIYGLSAYIYKASLCDEICKWTGHTDWENPALQKPIDALFDEYIYPNFQSYCGKFPIVTQIMDHSTINNGVWNNHYIMTYNWKSYINDELPNSHFDYDTCLKIRSENE
jgi:hypothetical protein